MIEDKLLILRCKRGSRDALRRVYQKYKDDLLVLAMVMLNDASAAEDVLHDVFVAFVGSLESFRLTGSLKSYLATCVANRARNVNRAKRSRHVDTGKVAAESSDADPPDQSLLCNEQLEILSRAIGQLADEQREVIMLHLRSNMKFPQIAKSLDISVNTIKSRYRYGIDKLRSILTKERQEK
ncbi:MAG: RNA polymerase sigma factor [Planctomycetota bacterium]|jgi:RNA polymerase sigma-70 factor (ECF subfamily)